MHCFFEKGIRTREWEETLKITQPHPSILLMQKQRPGKQAGHNRVGLPPHGIVDVNMALKNGLWHMEIENAPFHISTTNSLVIGEE